MYLLISQAEIKILDGWNFIDDYNKKANYRSELIELGCEAYTEYCNQVNMLAGLLASNATMPRRRDRTFSNLYKQFINGSTTFTEMVENKLMISPDDEEYYADLLARYILEFDWQLIHTIP